MKIDRFKLALGAALLVGANAVQAQAPAETLYQRVGGYDALAKLGADFTRSLGTDPTVRPFFFARSDDSRRRILQAFVLLLCADTGGPCFYTGRDMKSAHAGLKMGDAEWDAVMRLWGEALDRHKIAGANKSQMVQVFAKYRGEIMSGRK
jgi:hemoglobin